jgi:class 3 adenylate cyclase/GAF domain-containing protein
MTQLEPEKDSRRRIPDSGDSTEAYNNKVFIETLQISKNIAEKVNSILDFEFLLNTVIEIGVNRTRAEKGFLLLCDENSESPAIRATVNVENEEPVLNKMVKLFTDKVLPYLRENNTIILDSKESKDNIRSILATRLKFRDSVTGYLCLLNKLPSEKGKIRFKLPEINEDKSANFSLFEEDDETEAPVKIKTEPEYQEITLGGNLIDPGLISTEKARYENFSQHDVYLLEIIATHSAIAINNVQLYEKVEYETGVRNNLQRYLPKNTIMKLLDRKIKLSMVGELQDCSILFADICGFTGLAEKLKPQEVVSFLNEYLTIMTKVIFSYNGSIDKFIGDGIMAVFGAPISTPNHAMEATLAALEMRKQIPVLRDKFFKEFAIENFNIRIGINTGPVVYGNVGSPQRLDFTVIGDSVNVAARMESNAPNGGILVSSNTYKYIKDMVEVRALGAIKVKGKRDPVKIFEVIDKINAPDPLSLKVSVPEKAKNILKDKKIMVKSFVVINKQGDLTNGLMRTIGVKCVSIGVVGKYSVSQQLTLSFKLSEKFSFKNIRGVVKKVEKTSQEGINNKSHLLIEVEFVELSKTDISELAKFIHNS